MDSVTESLRGLDLVAESKMLISADGTRIASFKLGSGPIAWVMPPAMGDRAGREPIEAWHYCALRMILSENRYPLFGIKRR